MDINDDEIKKVIRLALIEQRVRNILARRAKTSNADPEINWDTDKKSGKNRN